MLSFPTSFSEKRKRRDVIISGRGAKSFLVANPPDYDERVKTIKLGEYIDDFVNIGNEYVHRKYIQIQMVINPDNSENVDGCTYG
ncbi:hypothetical protein RN001_008219 [Aquatica leii]|uniref:Uncharacterized protein n=1 Tax=Aquatica leii TaxID=1421715 RepID=A0AAN7PAG9_9COLE|nr:hypothetical protein RN001_008219 [Aquatica leii]